MKATISHLSLNVSDFKKSVEFYSKMMPLLGFKESILGDDYAGWMSGDDSVWINSTHPNYSKVKFHRKQTGINHICFRVGSKKSVEKFAKEFVQANKAAILYNTPKAFPEYGKNYYAVFFEDPDRVKIEVAYY